MLFRSVIGAMVITAVNQVDFLDAVYETASAYATVGLTVGITGAINKASQLILIIYMFLGRVGLTTVVVTIMIRNKKHPEARIRYPNGKFLIG